MSDNLVEIRQERMSNEKSSVKFFDPQSPDDLKDLESIILSPEYKYWMDDSEDQTKVQLQKWMKERRNDTYLVAVSGSAENGDITEVGRVQGFIWIYKAPNFGKDAYEISYAKRPDALPRQMAAGLRQTLLKFNREFHSGSGNEPHIKVISQPWIMKFRGQKPNTEYQKSRAEVVMNEASIKVTEAAGFERYRDSNIWRLNWFKLRESYPLQKKS